MHDVPAPVPPAEQVVLRAWVDVRVRELGVSSRRLDRCRGSDDGRVASCGWGDRIDRGEGREAIRVWYDALDSDIAITGERGEYAEWHDLSDMTAVLAELDERLRRMLAAPAPRRRRLRELLP
jgi:hypothetical protein